MGWDVGGHAHGDARCAVDQEVGQGGGQDARLGQGTVKVGAKVDRVLVDVGQHLFGDEGQASLGVAHGRRVVAVDRAKVALAVDQHVAEAEVLGHADHRLVDGGVAVGMVLAQDLADDAGALFVGLVGPQAQVVHGVQDAAVDRLEAVAHVGQGAGDDDAHGVVEVGALHLLVDVDLSNGS